MDCVGFARVRVTPVKTRNLWGDLSEISGQLLPVIERNEEGDCLCILKDKGLVDVDHVDVCAYIPNPQKTMEQAFRDAFKI